MRWLCLPSLLLLLPAVAACDGDDEEGDLIRVNDASDEVFLTLTDEEAQGNLMTDPTRAATITMPAAGGAITTGTPTTIAWTLPAQVRVPRHGVANGTFFWLRFTGAGISDKVDVLAVGVMSWTPSADDWARIAVSPGTLTARLVTAVVDDALVVEGPWVAEPDVTWSVTN